MTRVIFRHKVMLLSTISLVLPLNESTDAPLASSALNGKKLGDSSQICDYRFLAIIITNQSTNIENYRVLRPDKGLH